jgi:PhzF family phenazine biosynthesis protein
MAPGSNLLPMNSGTLHRVAAFTSTPEGGNPAGVWVGATLPDPAEMQQIAKTVGFSETAFIAPTVGFDRTIRYYSPVAEVPFCGHATIATGVILGQRDGNGTYHLATTVGTIPVTVTDLDGQYRASLTSVAPMHKPAPEPLVDRALATLGWTAADLDLTIPPVQAYAGAWHLILAVKEQYRLNTLVYDFEALKQLMLAAEWTTLQLIWREDEGLFHARNPFPIGGIIEDPATGSAAAALGGYLRDAQLITAPKTIIIRQGEAMGRPSRIVVDMPVTGGIIVTGEAVLLEAT